MNSRVIRWTLAFVALASPTFGQEQGEIQDGIYIESIDVNVINVEVFVTDKKGEPVTGLTIDDFEIYEDKKPVKVTNFYAVEGGRPQTPLLADVPDEPEVAEPELSLDEPEEIIVPADQRLHLVVYIDNFNIRPFNRNRVFRRLRDFLNRQLGPHDRVMLVSYNRSLKYEHPFTSSPDLIARALFDLEEKSGAGVHVDSDRNDLLRAISEAENPNDVIWQVRTFAESGYNDLSFTVGAMEEIVESLAGIPGRKALLYVSDGLPMSPGEELFYAIHQKFHDTYVISMTQDFNAHRLFKQLAARANSNRVTFYTIDAAGLRPPTAGSVEHATVYQAGMTTFFDTTMIQNLQAPLLNLAEETGGQAIINRNDVGEGLAKVARDFKTYYSLGYTPSHSGTGRYYDVEVKLKNGKGLRVRHRSGYRDKPVATRMADGTLATLYYGVENNPLGIGLTLQQSAPDADKYYIVDITVEIPLDTVTLVPQTDFHEGRAKLFFAAMDERGGLSEVQEMQVPIRIPNDRIESARGQLYPYQVQLKMRPGPHRLAVGVIDEFGSSSSFLSKSFVVGSG